MKEPQPGEITELLARWSAGESGADERLFSLIYRELRKLAAYHMRREDPGRSEDVV